MKNFKTLTTKQYNALTAKFTGSKAGDSQEEFYTYCANCAYQYIEHKDATHLNNFVSAGMSRGYAVLAVAKKLNAHVYNVKLKQFTGKMSRSKMQALTNVDDDDIAVYEAIIMKWVQGIADRIHADAQPKEKVKLTADKAQRKIDNTFESLAKEGFTLEQVIAMFNQSASKYSKSLV